MSNFFNVFRLFFTFTLVLVLVSCGKDDDNGPIQASIYGEWVFDELSYDTRINGVDFETYLTENHDFTLEEAEAIEGPYLQNITSEEMAGTIMILNEDGTYDIQEGTLVENGTFLLEENHARLTLISSDEQTVFEIIELSNHTMILNFPMEFMEDITEDGEEDRIEVDHILTFVR